MPHIFYFILQYTSIPSLTKRFEMVTATLRKNFGPPMTKQNSCLQEDQELCSTCTFLGPIKLTLKISNIFLHLTFKLLIVLNSRLYFKERWQILRVNSPKTIRIENAQFTRFCLYVNLCVAHSPHLY